MIVFDLACDNAHRFEGWFGSSADFTRQQEEGLLICPACGSAKVAKAPMAPAIGAKGNSGGADGPPTKARSAPSPSVLSANNRQRSAALAPELRSDLSPQLAKAFATIAKAQAKALKNSAWVGDKFADEVRSMHYGEKDEAPIHGRASARQARDLVEEGIGVAPLLIPVIPPEERN